MRYYRIDLYFASMTAFSLFHRPTFEHQLYNELPPELGGVLLAAMFAYSARFVNDNDVNPTITSDSNIKPARFYGLAADAGHAQLRKCGNKPPPLSLVQSLILTTFYELVGSLRGVAWRSLGTVIRVAYELQLHMVDSPLPQSSHISGSNESERWIRAEERRRAWWTIWELEVFATTIRKCPSGIDQREHTTWLPVGDSQWFSGHVTPSCPLEIDPTKRWKALQTSGNDCSSAWYIVINSLMRDAHRLSIHTIPPKQVLEETDLSQQTQANNPCQVDPDSDPAADLAILDNCIMCFDLALPTHLQYRQEFLFPKAAPRDRYASRTSDCKKQLIYAMTQLARLMVLHKECFGDNIRVCSMQFADETSFPTTSTTSRTATNTNQTTANVKAAWSRYLEAADSIVSVIRNTSLDHIRYGHPLLANTVWMVAAIQVVQKTFARTKAETRLAQSNLDLLSLTIFHHITFWGSSSIFLDNLKKLETAMDSIRKSNVLWKSNEVPLNTALNQNASAILAPAYLSD